MKYDLLKIGERIRAIREKENITQETLAEDFHISRNTLSKIENGVEKDGRPLVSFKFLLEFGERFNCDMGYLLGEYEEKTKVNADICKETELSEKAVESLKAFKSSIENKQIISFLNMLIEELYNNRYICGDICDLIENTDDYFSKLRSAPVKLRYASSAKEVHETGKEIADLSAAVNGGKYVLSEFFGKFLERFCLLTNGISSDEAIRLKIDYADTQQQVYKDGVNNGEHTGKTE